MAVINTQDLTLPFSNQYSSGEVTAMANGDLYLERKTLNIKPKIEDKWHTIKKGDRLDLLANTYYYGYVNKTEGRKLWWILADANNIDNPFNLSDFIGASFLIPDYFRVQQLITTQTNDSAIQSGDLITEEVGQLIESVLR